MTPIRSTGSNTRSNGKRVKTVAKWGSTQSPHYLLLNEKRKNARPGGRTPKLRSKNHGSLPSASFCREVLELYPQHSPTNMQLLNSSRKVFTSLSRVISKINVWSKCTLATRRFDIRVSILTWLSRLSI